MKTLFYLLLVSLICLSCNTQDKPHELKVITFNIRFDNPGDAPNDWKNRIPVVRDYLNAELPDIMGVQEALYHQNEDILEMLPGYAYLGTGRDDGKRSGEFSPIFYNTGKLEVVGHSQFWLSETPDVPGSIGWEAILPRVVTWARFKHIDSQNEFYVFNTHYSHVSDLARKMSMEFMSEKIQEIAGDEPVIVTGDFNITKGSELYNHMVNHLKEQNNLNNAELIALNIVPPVDNTFNGYRDDVNPRVIDYIFVNHHFDVKKYAVDTYKQDSLFVSDHWPVRVSLQLK
jgi:endonuclease/exonuclease/phosphatase family metal-dependent hydrolase